MQIERRLLNVSLLFLVFCSGFVGLIYQVTWQRYLAILLGAQAKATVLVLAVFLGGISLGYRYFGKRSERGGASLFKTFSLVEISLGAWALFFPTLFHIVMRLASKSSLISGLESSLPDFIYSIILIGLPAFLMGGTVPLLTQAMSTTLEEGTRVQARIYGLNTLGAALGCFSTGYYFNPNFSFANTLYVAGGVNIAIGIISYFLTRSQVSVVVPSQEASETQEKAERPFIAIAFLSGFTLITLETVLIRLMGLSTGASNYHFSLIVSIFILGLGLGGLFIGRLSRRTGGLSTEHLFWGQVSISGSLLLLFLSADYWSYDAHLIRVFLKDLPQGFAVYHFLLGAFFTSLLIIPVGLAGTTLPLIFHLVRDRYSRLGYRAGQVLGWNALGCVLGAILGGYVSLLFFNLDGVFRICSALTLVSVGLSAWLNRQRLSTHVWQVATGAAVMAFIFFGILFSPSYSHDRWIQPFRYTNVTSATFEGAKSFGNLLGGGNIIYWKDDPNSSIGITSNPAVGNQPESRSIIVNGKSDGSTSGDYFTTALLAHIPGLLSPQMERVCVIGFGTGVTIGILANYPEIKQIDVAEISSASIESAHFFDPFNLGASSNPKVRFHQMDALRYMAGVKENFDVVVSEPSNPWVAGVENLYSREFYELAKNRLTPQGLLVQWIHSYSFNDDLLKLVTRTLQSVFPHVSIFQLTGGDLALVAYSTPVRQEQLLFGAERMKNTPGLQRQIAGTGLENFESILAREIVPEALTLVLSKGDEIQTLENPKLSARAARAFFANESAELLTTRKNFREYLPSLKSSLLHIYLNGAKPTEAVAQSFKRAFCESVLSADPILCSEAMALNATYAMATGPEEASTSAYSPLTLLRDGTEGENKNWKEQVLGFSSAYLAYASPIFTMPKEKLLRPIEECVVSVSKADELFGACLLQKYVLIGHLSESAKELGQIRDQYANWFSALDQRTPNYQSFLSAAKYLETEHE